MVALPLLVASALAWGGEPSGVVYDFMSTTCPPCQQMSPIVSRLQRQGYPIQKVDIRENPELARRFRITNIPAFVVVVDDNEVQRIVGATSEENLRQLCALIPQKPADPPPAEKAKSAPAAQPARVTANAVDLGDAAALPKSAPDRTNEEKSGIFGGLFGKKNVKLPPAGPTESRAQEGDSIGDIARQPASPLTATVRLRIRDAQGESFGTGTIVDSRPGRTLILTCGHVFRHWTKGSQIHVDLFRGEQALTIIGKRLAHELDADTGLDIGLISIATDQPLPACQVAPAGTRLLVGASVASVGCGGGEKPTVQRQKITALNRYQGADNIECSAVPVEGRSGGGLFDRNDRLIGICMCADPKYREGLYAGLRTIHRFLDRQQLSHLYRGESAEPEELQFAAAEETVPRAAEAGKQTDRRTRTPSTETQDTGADEPLAQPESVTQEDIVGSEVVIIIHAKGKPGAPSKVVRLHRASRGFWEDLLPELDPRQPLQETSLTQATGGSRQQSARREVRRPVETEPAVEATRPSTTEPVFAAPQAYRRNRS